MGKLLYLFLSLKRDLYQLFKSILDTPPSEKIQNTSLAARPCTIQMKRKMFENTHWSICCPSRSTGYDFHTVWQCITLRRRRSLNECHPKPLFFTSKAPCLLRVTPACLLSPVFPTFSLWTGQITPPSTLASGGTDSSECRADRQCRYPFKNESVSARTTSLCQKQVMKGILFC